MYVDYAWGRRRMHACAQDTRAVTGRGNAHRYERGGIPLASPGRPRRALPLYTPEKNLRRERGRVVLADVPACNLPPDFAKTTLRDIKA